MTEANAVRGEVELKLGDRTFVLKPEEGRAVRLDDALPRGILGTLMQLTSDRSIKVRQLATVVRYLADGAPGEDELCRLILQEPLLVVTTLVARALQNIAGGSGSGSGEAEAAPSDPATGSTGAAG